MNMNNK